MSLPISENILVAFQRMNFGLGATQVIVEVRQAFRKLLKHTAK